MSKIFLVVAVALLSIPVGGLIRLEAYSHAAKKEISSAHDLAVAAHAQGKPWKHFWDCYNSNKSHDKNYKDLTKWTHKDFYGHCTKLAESKPN